MPGKSVKKKRRRQAVPPGLENAAPKWMVEREAIQRLFADEPDPAWQTWFIEVEQKRRAPREARPMVVFTVEKDNGRQTIARRKSIPEPVGKQIRKHLPGKFSALGEDYREITRLWRLAVGDAVADESRLHSFKGGVVTMEIHSSSLLQEIRQFHQAAILADLRDIWTLRHPLLTIRYAIGKR